MIMVVAGKGAALDNPRARSVLLVEHGVVSGSDRARALGGWIGDERRRRGLRQDAAAEQIGVSGSILGTWETGVGVPGAVSMDRLRKWLGRERWKDMLRFVQDMEQGSGGTAVSEPVDLPADGGGESVPVKGGRKGKRAARVVGADDVLAAIMAWDEVPGAGRGMLCGAVVALAAGASIEVEIRSRA